MLDRMTSKFSTSFSRRDLLRAGLAGGISLAGIVRPATGSESELPPVRTITHGPKFH